MNSLPKLRPNLMWDTNTYWYTQNNSNSYFLYWCQCGNNTFYFPGTQVGKSTSPGRQPCFILVQQGIEQLTAILLGFLFHVSTFWGNFFFHGRPQTARRAGKNGQKGETANSAVPVILLLKWDETPAKPPWNRQNGRKWHIFACVKPVGLHGSFFGAHKCWHTP